MPKFENGAVVLVWLIGAATPADFLVEKVVVVATLKCVVSPRGFKRAGAAVDSPVGWHLERESARLRGFPE